MKILKNIIYIITLTVCFNTANAQQDQMFTHYKFNQLATNPAYAGSLEGGNIMALHRSQWVAFKGAPFSQIISGDFSLPKANLGLGFSVNNDIIGPTVNTGITANVAYKINFGNEINKSTLAFGLRGSLNFVSIRLNDMEIINNSDVTFKENIDLGVTPNFGAGVYYYTEKYYVGFSIPNLLHNGINVSSIAVGSVDIENQKRHYYVTGGGEIKISKMFVFEPSATARFATGSPINFEITALIKYDDVFWFGPAYRFDDAVSFLAGVKIAKKFEVGYAFDWSYTNATLQNNAGSHEIMLRYRFLKKTSSDKLDY